MAQHTLLKKDSTIYKKTRLANAPSFQKLRNEFIETMVNSKPRMNIRITLSDRPF